MEANDDTMAAARAAIAIPLKPAGKNCINHGKALSEVPAVGIFCIPPSPRLPNNVGSLTIT